MQGAGNLGRSASVTGSTVMLPLGAGHLGSARGPAVNTPGATKKESSSATQRALGRASGSNGARRTGTSPTTSSPGPGQYLAGAYPCLSVLDEHQSTIKTVAKAAQIAYDTAVENAKLHCGKIVNLMLAVVGGDYAEVVNQLIRPGIPSRIDPYSYHVRQNPVMLDRSLRGAAA
jgi:hypothetical protein